MTGIREAIHSYIRVTIRSKAFVQSDLFKLLKSELGTLGHWKALPRGKPDVKNFKNSTDKERMVISSDMMQ